MGRFVQIFALVSLLGCGASAPAPQDMSDSQDLSSSGGGDMAAMSGADMSRTGSMFCHNAGCRKFSSYCSTTGCACIGVVADNPDPVCAGTMITCAMDPCVGKTVTCNHGTGQCVVQ